MSKLKKVLILSALSAVIATEASAAGFLQMSHTSRDASYTSLMAGYQVSDESTLVANYDTDKDWALGIMHSTALNTTWDLNTNFLFLGYDYGHDAMKLQSDLVYNVNDAFYLGFGAALEKGIKSTKKHALGGENTLTGRLLAGYNFDKVALSSVYEVYSYRRQVFKDIQTPIDSTNKSSNKGASSLEATATYLGFDTFMPFASYKVKSHMGDGKYKFGHDSEVKLGVTLAF